MNKGMELVVRRASDLSMGWWTDLYVLETVHICCVNRLKQFIQECGHSVVINHDCNRITIYDDYLE